MSAISLGQKTGRLGQLGRPPQLVVRGPPRLRLAGGRGVDPDETYELLRDVLRRALTNGGWHMCSVPTTNAPTSFVWTKTAEQALAKATRDQATSGTLH